MTNASTTPTTGPLQGIRVLELGQLIAGPFAGYLLGAFGAEVVKVEPPGLGDPLRRWRKLHGDTSLWWYALARNKKSITCDLRTTRGQELVRELVRRDTDILIENFRPGKMEDWGLGWNVLSAENPRLVMVRISGYGQSGPYAQRPGFANVAEAFGGLRYITGEPDRPPVRSGVSLGDSLAGMHGAFAALAAIHDRDVVGSGKGQVIDVALYESVFNLLESTLTEYDVLGHIRERTGARLDGVVPSNSYRCRDGRYVAIGANADGLYRRLMHLVGRSDLADDPRLRHNDGRAQHFAIIDDAIAAWACARDLPDILADLIAAEIPAGPINSIADIVADPHVQSRGVLEAVRLPDGTVVKMPAAVPFLSRTPATTRWPGPELGAHNREIYGALGLSEADLAELCRQNVI